MRVFAVVLMLQLLTQCSVIAARPDVVWIEIEDASPHIGCYGESSIRRPAMDGLARDGIHFTQVFVTAPVCSSSHSAMVSGTHTKSLKIVSRDRQEEVAVIIPGPSVRETSSNHMDNFLRTTAGLDPHRNSCFAIFVRSFSSLCWLYRSAARQDP